MLNNRSRQCLYGLWMWNPSFLSASTKMPKAAISFVMFVCRSLCPHGITQLPLNEFLSNLGLEYFSKIFRDKLNFVTICQEKRVLCIKACVHLWSYLAQFFLEWEMFQKKHVEKIKTQILCTIFMIISRSVLLRMRNVSDKTCRENQNTNFMYSICDHI